MRRVVRRRIFLGSVAAVLVVGYATLDVYDVVPGVLTLANAPDAQARNDFDAPSSSTCARWSV